MSTQQEMNDSISTSPTRKSRQQEKEELAHLNDRFASYIEQVRSLKELNLNYEYQLKVVKEQLGRETDDIKKLYEAELRDARTLIDETAKEKAKQQLIASKNASRVRELETEVKELKDELEAMKNRVAAAERNVTSMDAQRKAAVTEKASLQKESKEKDAEIEELRANIEELRTLLETETLCKVDLQNNLQSLNEELAFRKKVYEEELQGLRTKITTTSFSSQVDTSTVLDPGSLEATIDELRERSDMGIADYKERLDAIYRDKIAEYQDTTARDATIITQLTTDIRKTNSSISDYKNEIVRLQKLVENLEDKLNFREEEMNRLAQKNATDLSRLSADIQALREKYENKIKEYEALMDLKIQLDQEIATYRALLQEEENRLNLTPTPRREKRTRSTDTSTQGVKKPRVDPSISQQKQSQPDSTISSSAAGCIQICDVDPAGRFVQIKNMSGSAESIGNFKIVHSVSGQKEIVFKFHPKSKLQGGAAVTVWAAEADGAVHSPPHDIVWRGHPTWGSGSTVVTKLVSKSGEFVATFTQRSESSPVKSRYDTVDANLSFPHLSQAEEPAEGGRVTRTTTTTTTTSGGREHMFHQQGDPQHEDPGRQSCVIS